MGKLVVAVLIIGALAYAWHAGWIAQLIGSAVDSGMDSVRSTQRNATTVRPIDAPADKK